MRTKQFPLIMTSLLILSLLFAACKPEEADTMTEEDMALAIEQTLAAMPTEEPTDAPPTDIPEPTATLEPTTPPEPTEIPHTMIPGEPPAAAVSEIMDVDSSVSAEQASAAAGDDFNNGLYERPFSGDAMEYRPDLDITHAILSSTDDFMYVEVTLSGEHVDGGLQGTYGFELDLDKDGRGDVLVLASNLQAAWSTDGVFAWEDNNSDVGGETPVIADEAEGDGYDTLVFEEGMSADPDLVWARINPADTKSVQLAFKPALAKDTSAYLWWAVTDSMVKDPALYDYNDHFTLEEAGSPIAGTVEYPVKALAEMDNTCSWTSGYTPESAEPRMCGAIGGILPGETVTMQVFSDSSCTGPYLEFDTALATDFSFGSLAAGIYCVKILGMECGAGAAAQVVTLPLDSSFDWNLFCNPDN